MSPADTLLALLHRLKRTGPHRWHACCPAHDDRSPSLNLRELEDGRLLLHCFGGCSVQEVVSALGLQMTDLFPPQATQSAGHQPVRRAFSAGDLIDLAAWEAGVALVIVSDVLNGPAAPDFDRLLVAAGRLADVKEAIHGSR